MTLRYQIKNASDRNKINLKKPGIEESIINGVLSVFKDAKVDVFNKYFTITNIQRINNSQLQSMGHNIVYGHKDLIGIIRTYTYKKNDGTMGQSNQVFSKF